MNARGFTLMETMVTLAVFTLLLLAVAPSMSDWMINLRIRHSASELQRGFQVARQEAIRRNQNVTLWLVTTASGDASVLDDTCQLSASSGSWVVSARTPAGQCSAAPSVTTAPMVVARHAQGRDGRQVLVSALGSSGTATSVTFNNLGQLSGSNPIALITVKAENNSANYRSLCVEVSGLGTAQVCDPALDIGQDPRACQRQDCKDQL